MVNIRKEIGLTYDDVALVPAYTNIDSRLTPSTVTWVTKKMTSQIPIINAPMDTVIGPELADVLLELGGVPVFARSNSLDHYRKLLDYRENSIVSTGVSNYKLIQEVVDLGFKTILLDTANFWTRHGLTTLQQLKKQFAHVEFIAGNVCTAMGYVDLVNSSADAVRVGGGGGSVCITRLQTGIGVSQFTAVTECADMALKYKVPVWADGGIKGPRELCLAIAGGATVGMVGKILALTYESAAPKKEINGVLHACYRGQASKSYQIDHYGGVKAGTVPEGEEFWAPVTKSAKEVIGELLGGLRSSMSYLGAKDIKEYQRKAEFIQVTPAYTTESSVRPN